MNSADIIDLNRWHYIQFANADRATEAMQRYQTYQQARHAQITKAWWQQAIYGSNPDV